MSDGKYVRLEVEEDRGDVERKGMSGWMAGISYVKSTVGLGIFALPFALRYAGMALGLVGFGLIALQAWYCVSLLVAVVARSKAQDYAGAGRAALGSVGAVLANLAVIASQIGSHVVHILFITGVLSRLVPAVPPVAWALILSPVFVLLSWIRNAARLWVSSFVGVGLLVGAVVCVLVYGFINLPAQAIIASQVNHPPEDFFLYFGTSVYVFEGINMVIPIRREMAEPDNFMRVFTIVTLIMALTFSAFAVCGYVFFLDLVRQIVLFNLPLDTGWVAVPIVVVVELVVSFPNVFFPLSWAVEHSLFPSVFHPHDAPVFTSGKGWVTNIVRMVLVYAIIVPAALIPRISVAVSLSGAFAQALSGIILPTLFYVIVFWDDIRVFSKIFHILLMLVGVFCMAATATFAIAQIANIAAGNLTP